jgi:hypothetical protein
MREALAGQFENMEETWDNLLQCVREYSIDTDSDVAFKELADVMRSTRRVLNAALDLSGHFTQMPTVQVKVVGVPDTDEGVNVDGNTKAADDAGGDDTGRKADNKSRQENAGGTCTGGLEDVGVVAGGVEAGPQNMNCGTDVKDVRVCQDTDAVQQWTGLIREKLGKALKERWNKDPEVCFCKDPGKHPGLISNELPEGQRSVFDTSRRSCYIGVGKIEEFMAKIADVTLMVTTLEELKSLQAALRRQWGYMRTMISSEGTEVLKGSGNLVSATGYAVCNALVSSSRFIQENMDQG